MSGYAWLGVLVSTFVTSLALAGYIVMALPYLDNAPFLTELRHNTRIPKMIGAVMVLFFFVIYYFSARYLDSNNSGPLLAFAGFIVALPVSMLIGSETWEHYNPKGMNNVPGVQAIFLATGIGLAEMGAALIVFVVLM